MYLTVLVIIIYQNTYYQIDKLIEKLMFKTTKTHTIYIYCIVYTQFFTGDRNFRPSKIRACQHAG